jgi:hypothetical protein
MFFVDPFPKIETGFSNRQIVVEVNGAIIAARSRFG